MPTKQQLVSFIESNPGKVYETLKQRKKFEASVGTSGLVFYVHSTNNDRLQTWTYLDNFLAQFNHIKSLKSADYNLGSRNIAYLLSITYEVLCCPTIDIVDFENKVRELGELNHLPPAKGNERPEKISKEIDTYKRDPAVKLDVLTRADGSCELCGKPAPFIKNSGEPFLEVHHIIPLAETGPDTVENAVGLCPNCHREVHYGVDRDKLTKKLTQRL